MGLKILLHNNGKLRNSVSIKKIKESQQTVENYKLLFEVIGEEAVKNTVTDLPINKLTISGHILAYILKQHAQI